MTQQARALQLADLLVALAVGNDAQLVSGEALQAWHGIFVSARESLVFDDECPVARICFLVGQLRRSEYFPHARAPLLPDRKFSSAEPVEMLIEDFLPDGRKLVTLKRNGSGKMIKETQAGRRGGAGVVDQRTVNVEKNHSVSDCLSGMYQFEFRAGP